MADDIAASASRARLSVSSWSLHRALGRPDYYGPEHALSIPVASHGRGEIALLDLPERVAKLGITTLEICHFHLPTLERGFLDELRSVLEGSGVELFSLLVDGGDLTDHRFAARDQAWIRGWITVAATLGARRMRVIAGKAPLSDATLAQSSAALTALANEASQSGVRLMTENWFGLLSRPESVITLFEQLDGAVGLCLDFGNWGGRSKYEDLAAIAHLAESCHAKPQFTGPASLDAADFTRCLELTQAVGFAGPYTLVYDGPQDDEWAGIALVRDAARPFVAAS